MYKKSMYINLSNGFVVLTLKSGGKVETGMLSNQSIEEHNVTVQG